MSAPDRAGQLLDGDAQRFIAERLHGARAAATAIAPPSRERAFSIQDAYEIQLIGVRVAAESGRQLSGHKVGLTSAVMQAMYGIDEPDFGHLFADMEVAAAATLDAGALCDPRVEPELAFVLGASLHGPGATAEEVMSVTTAVRGCIEVIDSRVGSEDAQLVDSVADNAGAAHYVLSGDPATPASMRLDDLEVRMHVDGARYVGRSDAVLGHPANAVAWLANKLSEFGVELRAGQVVLSGSMTRAAPVRAGSRVTADFGALGAISLRFT